MKKFLSKAANFWYYNKTMCIVLALVAAGFLYTEFSGRTEEADCSAAVISSVYYTDEEKAQLKQALEAVCPDRNGNGRTTVDVTYYTVALGADNQDESLIGALDADLMMGVSGLLLLESPEAFRASTSGIEISDPVSVGTLPTLAGCGFDDLYAAIRTDCSSGEYFMQVTGTAA